MRIELKKVVPLPMRDDLDSGCEVWNRDIGFRTGSVNLIVSNSGRGKTTLIHYLYGIRSDFDGKILFNGEDTGGFTLDQWTRLRRESLAIVFQDLRLFGNLTGWENLHVKQTLAPRLNDSDLEDLARKMDILRHLERPVSRMSLGQQQRIVILRALCQPFAWLLLDEPFSHLDPDNIAIVREMILQHAKQTGAGVILTTLSEDYGISADAVYHV